MKDKDEDFNQRTRQSEKGRKSQKVRNIIKGLSIREYQEEDLEEITRYTKNTHSRRIWLFAIQIKNQ